ncbi:MAG: hypothetical protein DMG68_01720 [Acidobacteria bacterium]|nr:MAG: hypothetical protein DMG68_01720 [Acidobacteriota bacterium]
MAMRSRVIDLEPVSTMSPSLSRRLLVSSLIATSSGIFCWYLLHHFHQGAADFQWTIRAAQYFLRHANPYDTPLEQYPMTAALFAIPFVRLMPEIAASLFFGISSGLLALGLTREGYSRLLIFLAYPYWAAILTVQWAPLIAASAFFPWLLPATLAKPQVGLPVAVTHLSRRGLIVCTVCVLATLLWMPSWPFLWWKQVGNYQHFYPLLVLPGPLLALALLRYRERDAWLLFIASLMPQRWFFDAFTLWLIPRSRRQILFTAMLSWGAGIWRWYHMPTSFTQVGRWTVVFLYLPMLLVVLLREAPSDGS